MYLRGGAVRLAQDRRAFDTAGRMSRPGCNLTRAMVSEYLGREIPDGERLGLQPNTLYPLLRDPDELQASADAWDGCPLVITHKPMSASDHAHDIVCGTVNNVVWNAPYLVGDLSIWTDEAIQLVESGEQQQISCGYGYQLDLTPGAYQGVRYVGVMRKLAPNHVALVALGRVGPDCIVGDEAPKFSSFKQRNPEVYKEAVREMQRIRVAEAEVAPVVGAVVGMDSAAQVYQEALRRIGVRVQLNEIGLAGGPAMFKAACGRRRVMATDSLALKARHEMFPHATRMGG